MSEVATPSASATSSGPEPLLTASGVHKRFGRRTVLTDANFRAFPGTIVAILGENGSGKSTLLKVLAGILRADHGTVRCSCPFGYCPQEAVLYPYLTPDEHFELFACAYGLSRERAHARSEALLDRLAFAPWRRRPVNELSGGTKQKLNLALSILHDPPLLLLDEPYAGFDIETYGRFIALSEEARAANKCVVLVTHLVFERQRFDAVYHIRDGGIHVDP